MTTPQEILSRLKRLDAKMADWIPSRDTWNAADEALYRPIDLFRVPLNEAQEMQLKAIRYAFMRHYNNNKFYHNYCQEENVRPDDIKTADDLDKIPLIPDTAFKQYPSGKDFAFWLSTVFTGGLPNVVIKGANPTFDEVINAFKAAGITIMHSSGTSGMSTVIPKDVKTLKAAQYQIAKSSINQYDLFVDHALMCFPNPAKSNLTASIEVDPLAKLARNTHYLFDFDMSAEMMLRSMSRNTNSSGAAVSSAQSEMQQGIIARIIHCLERFDKTKETFHLAAAPFMLFNMMNVLQKEGKCFDFGERGLISTGGGWRLDENARIPLVDFRKYLNDVLGIPETHCFDVYSSTEFNGAIPQCPEGHYLHVPHTHCKPLVLDESFTAVGYGERGRFAFLDALANSYPGFIITGDQVRMLEHCPVCDRPGPVLDPEVQRAKGEETRGCAEQVRRAIAETLVPGVTDTR